jgi:hypothetical protein
MPYLGKEELAWQLDFCRLEAEVTQEPAFLFN